MKYNEYYFRKTDFFFIVGFPGSGKTHVMSDISYHLDLEKINSKFPCIFDDIRQIYIFGRFLDFHGESKKNINDGTDRMFSGVDTSKFITLIEELVHDTNNILMCEGISSVLCNVRTLKKVQEIGYKLHIIELNTPLDECIDNLINRSDYNKKIQKMIIEWKTKRIRIQENFIVYHLTQGDTKKLLLNAVSRESDCDIVNKKTICFKQSPSFKENINKIKSIMYSVNLKSQQLQNKNKNWMFQFHIGRTVTRFKKYIILV